MTPRDTIDAVPTTACAPWPRHTLDQAEWATMATGLVTDPTLDLLALWADPTHVHALLHDTDRADFVLASTAVEAGLYPALSPARPAAAWFERMIRDLWGHMAASGTDQRPWLDHGHWTATPPLAARPIPNLAAAEPIEFLPVEAATVLLGPVHASIAEPALFRFATEGETILSLEIRLGYLHKGTLGLLRSKSPRAAARFAARLSGDSTVAHAIAFARAAEAASAVPAPPRADALRAAMAEIERIAAHLADIAAVMAEAAFRPLQATCLRLRDAILEACLAAFGHRLMMDLVTPGGLAQDLDTDGLVRIASALEAVEDTLPQLTHSTSHTPTLLDRLQSTGIAPPGVAQALATGGPAGRAAGRAFDSRHNPGYPPYDRLDIAVPTLDHADVDARLRIRLTEIAESLRTLRIVLSELPQGPISVALPPATAEGLGWSEGPRGDIWHWLRLEAGLITQAFLCDPGWRLLPLLERTAAGQALSDFPLIERSFSLSCSGMDL